MLGIMILALGSLTTMDTVTYFSYSTYSVFDNNPVFWTDPSGADAVYSWDTGNYCKYPQKLHLIKTKNL